MSHECFLFNIRSKDFTASIMASNWIKILSFALLSSVANASGPAVALIAGGSTLNLNGEPTIVSQDTKHGVRCCIDAAPVNPIGQYWTNWPQCGATYGGAEIEIDGKSCHTETFETAAEICASVLSGTVETVGRLCTLVEIQNDCARGTGCGFDYGKVWVADAVTPEPTSSPKPSTTSEPSFEPSTKPSSEPSSEPSTTFEPSSEPTFSTMPSCSPVTKGSKSSKSESSKSGCSKKAKSGKKG